MPRPIQIYRIQLWFYLSCCELDYPFWANLVQKSKLFKTETGNSNILNLMVMLICSILDVKHPFWANLVQKIKIACLR